MTFTEHAWGSISDIRRAIEDHPFVTELATGSLAKERFGYYMAQDALYLAEYARVMSLAGGQARDSDEVLFWAGSATTAIAVERELHARFVDDLTVARMSPTCAAYTSHLGALAGSGSYPALVAGLLPCFWIYLDVGSRLLEAAENLDEHPFGPWISTYADPAFAESTARAREIVDRAATRVGREEQARMHEAFHTCSRYEWMFWDAAWRMERWPV